jgi:hypothetical protein
MDLSSYEVNVSSEFRLTNLNAHISTEYRVCTLK